MRPCAPLPKKESINPAHTEVDTQGHEEQEVQTTESHLGGCLTKVLPEIKREKVLRKGTEKIALSGSISLCLFVFLSVTHTHNTE